MFLIRRRDDRGSEDRSGIIDNSCSELVERCRYVTGGMECDLTPLPRTTDVSFVDNTPTPFLTHHSSSSSNFQTNFARSRPSRYRWYDLLLCSAPLLVMYNLTPWYHGCSNSTIVWTIPHPWRPPNVILRSSREHFWEMFLIRTRDDRGNEDQIVQHRQRLFLSWLSGAGTSQEV